MTITGDRDTRRLVIKNGVITVEDTERRRKPRQEEHQLQAACVRWFEANYPEYDGLLFAVPNGGRRDKVTGAMLREEGVRAGVSDLLLLVPSAGDHGLCIEMKTPRGRQHPSQKRWMEKVRQHGYRYTICRSLDDFAREMKLYMHFADRYGYVAEEIKKMEKDFFL